MTMLRGGLNGKGFHRLIYLKVWLPVGGLGGRIRQCDLVGGSESRGVGLKVSKPHT